MHSADRETQTDTQRKLELGRGRVGARTSRFHPRPRFVFFATMAGGGKNGVSLYAVLGVATDCSDADLRTAYRKLAMVRAPPVALLLALLCSALLCAAALFRWLSHAARPAEC